jgi:hypothetical protein
MALGKKTGGRKPGTKNHRTAARQEAIAAAGILPLDFMLMQLRDESLGMKDRFAAAQAAAPYLHPRLQNIDTKLTGDFKIEVVHFAASNPAT